MPETVPEMGGFQPLDLGSSNPKIKGFSALHTGHFQPSRKHQHKRMDLNCTNCLKREVFSPESKVVPTYKLGVVNLVNRAVPAV